MGIASSLSKLPLRGTGGFLWLSALILGVILGYFNIAWLNSLFDFIATVYTRLFQFVAVPTIALAVITTLASLGGEKNTGRIFLRTITYTLLTTFSAALVGLVLYLIIAPENLPSESIVAANSISPSEESEGGLTFYDHILSVVPNNIVTPFASGNVLSILIVSTAIGLALAHIIKKEKQLASQPDGDTYPSGDVGRGASILSIILALQDILYTLIHALIWALPLGIVAFAAQLSAQVSAGIIVGSLGKYVAVILGGNCIQFFIVLPLFLLSRGLNPVKVLKAMSPAVLMALFTKSSAATLPVTMRSAEENLKVRPEVARFVLPICTTINMNGCAAFILVTSLFVMQNGGLIDLPLLTPNSSLLTLHSSLIPTLILWLFIAVISAVGNAGVPMGCYFLTLSLMSGIGAPVSIMGIILPIFTIIDMIETAENVWSDSCVCAMVDKR